VEFQAALARQIAEVEAQTQKHLMEKDRKELRRAERQLEKAHEEKERVERKNERARADFKPMETPITVVRTVCAIDSSCSRFRNRLLNFVIAGHRFSWSGTRYPRGDVAR